MQYFSTQVITCHFPRGIVRNVISLDPIVQKLLLVAYNAEHFAVLEFNIGIRTVLVFDGLNRNIDQWKYHVVHSLREYGLVNLTDDPQISYNTEIVGKDNVQRLEITFSDQQRWLVGNSVFMRQRDGWNCGPIACAKVMEVLGYIKPGTFQQMGTMASKFRKMVMDKYAELSMKYNNDLLVETHMRVNEDGDNVPTQDNNTNTEDCFCGEVRLEDTVHILTCCGRKVHKICLLEYVRCMPFCMFCSTSMCEAYKTLPEEIQMCMTLTQTDGIVQSPLKALEEDIQLCMEVTPNEGVLQLQAEEDKANEEQAELAAKSKEISEAFVRIRNEEVEKTKSQSMEKTPSDEEQAVKDAWVEASIVVEDKNRKEAQEKKRKMQESSAQKEMKRRGDQLAADGLAVGAVVTLKVDYRTHSHAQGLVAIVYKCTETGSACVCCESGVLTHDGSQGDYYVPSDKFVISAGAGESAVLPVKLQEVRDDIMRGVYEYDKQPRISYAKFHQECIGAVSPCKRFICGCKGVCSKRCGCRKKNLDCTSTCGCSGNCNWRHDL